jgi:hypothetical protein
MVKGWHDRGLVGDEWQPLDGGAVGGMNFEPCPTAPGDVVFFDSYAPHQSAPNLTDQRLSFPPDIEREPDKEYVFRV